MWLSSDKANEKHVRGKKKHHNTSFLSFVWKVNCGIVNVKCRELFSKVFLLRKSKCFFLFLLHHFSVFHLNSSSSAQSTRWSREHSLSLSKYLSVILKEEKYYLLMYSIHIRWRKGKDLNSYLICIFGLMDLIARRKTKETLKLLQI